jgi:hypothetical protein
LETEKRKMAFEIPPSRQLPLALLLSLLIHALLLSLTFCGQGRAMPDMGLPWQARRAEAPDLRIELAPMKLADAKASDALPAAPVSEKTLWGQVSRSVYSRHCIKMR